jgi:hypothetical protein
MQLLKWPLYLLPPSKKLSPCMIGFLGSQGYNTKGLGDGTFYNGSLTAQSVYNTMGNPAIMIGKQPTRCFVGLGSD